MTHQPTTPLDNMGHYNPCGPIRLQGADEAVEVPMPRISQQQLLMTHNGLCRKTPSADICWIVELLERLL